MPHYKLHHLKTLLKEGRVRTTGSALMGAAALGLNLGDMLQVIMELTTKDFYKSMTTHADHTLWQDVYRPTTQHGAIYLKLSVQEDVLIISFKEL